MAAPFIGLAMNAIDKAMDTKAGDEALDAIVKKPLVEKNKKTNRKKRRTSGSQRPTPAPRKRSERQAQRSSAGINVERTMAEEEALESRHSRSNNRNGPDNISGFTYSTCGTTAKTTKYNPNA